MTATASEMAEMETDMSNELTTTNAIETFRAIAADRMIAAARMTASELLAEFQRLTAIVDANTEIVGVEDDYPTKRFNETAKLALHEIAIVNGAAKAIFGLRFDSSQFDF